MPATIPANLVIGINSGDPAPAELTAPERRAYNVLSTFQGTRGFLTIAPKTTIPDLLVNSRTKSYHF
jgi:hypothetical protein